MIISRTPFRISFFGGGTDYPAWYRRFGGAVLGTTIDKYSYLLCRHLPPFFDFRYSIIYSQNEQRKTIDEIQHPVVREALRHFNFDRSLHLNHHGDLPARSGMGSSSAFTVGLLHTLHALRGRFVNKCELAKESIHIEQEILKENVGSQDQILTTYGGLNQIIFLPNGNFDVRPMTIPEDRKEALNNHLMLFYTGIRRTASSIAAGYFSDINKKEKSLRRMQEMAGKAIQILNGEEDLANFGGLLHEGWLLKQSLSPEISNHRIRDIYEKAIGAGALGGKLLGAGGGGFILFFVPQERQEAVRSSLRDLVHVPFRFEGAGSQIIFSDKEEDYSSYDIPERFAALTQFQELKDMR